MCRCKFTFNFNSTSNVTINSGVAWSRRLSVQQYTKLYDEFSISFIIVMYFVAASSIMSPDVSELSPFLLASLRLPSIAAVHTTDMYFCFIHYWFITSHLSVVRVFKRRWLWPVWKWTGIFKITCKTYLVVEWQHQSIQAYSGYGMLKWLKSHPHWLAYSLFHESHIASGIPHDK